MSNTDNQRVPCTRCGAMVLPITAKLYHGLCAQCRQADAWAGQEKLGAASEVPSPPLPTIDIRVDESRYDKQQLHLIAQIVRAIKGDLEKSGIPDERLATITGDIAFSIAAIIDGSRVMQVDGQTLIPVLTFADDAERTKLVTRAGGSFMHEYVNGTVDDVFDEDAA